jgi:hypothetical protein
MQKARPFLKSFQNLFGSFYALFVFFVAKNALYFAIFDR